jgi:hypothetical protein
MLVAIINNARHKVIRKTGAGYLVISETGTLSDVMPQNCQIISTPRIEFIYGEDHGEESFDADSPFAGAARRKFYNVTENQRAFNPDFPRTVRLCLHTEKNGILFFKAYDLKDKLLAEFLIKPIN